MRKTQYLVVAIALCCALVSGCQHNVKAVSNVPAGVSQNEVKDWYAAVGALDKVSQTNHATFLTGKALHDNGVWKDEPSFIVFIKALGRVDVLELNTAQILRDQPNNWELPVQEQVKGAVVEMVGQLAQAATQINLGVKDAKSQSNLNAELGAVQQSVQLIDSLIDQTVTGVKATPVPNTGVKQ